MEGLIEIKCLADIEDDIYTEIAIVFVDSYYKELKVFSDDKEKLVRIFKNSLVPEAFYVAIMDGHVAGILGCSDNKRRALEIHQSDVYENVGYLKGLLVHYMLEKEFNTPLSYENNIAYIECVATGAAARGKGVATKLLDYALKRLPYNEYRLTVTDTNKDALSIYEKNGFKEVDRMKATFFEKRRFNYKLYMKYTN